MPFGELLQTEVNEPKKESPKVTENFDKKVKYTNPELQNIHNEVMQKYPKTNEKNIQKILEKLDTEKVNDVYSKGSQAFNILLQTDPIILSEEKSEEELQRIIKIIKDEINNKNKEELVKNKEETVRDKEKLEQDKEIKINQSKENINKLYTEIPDKYKPKDEELKIFIQQNGALLGSIKKQLDAASISPNNYAKNLFTAQKLSQNNDLPLPQRVEFIKEFNKLNKLLDIDIQVDVPTSIYESGFKNKETKTDKLSDLQTDQDQILEVKSIQNYIDTGENILNDESFGKLGISDANILKVAYKKEDIENGFNAALKKAGKNIAIGDYMKEGTINTEKLKQDAGEDTYKQISENIKNLVDNGKQKIREITNTTMKERIVANVFKGLAGYFDSTNIHEENFAKDFKLNVKNDISIDNKTVNLNGTINGYNTGFYYDMETGKLQMDDVVHLDQDGIYQIGQKNGGKFTLPTNLPTLKELSDTAKTTDIKGILEHNDVKDLEGYQTTLVQNLNDELPKKFSHQELNKYYIEKYNEKNLAMQENIGYIFDNLGVKAEDGQTQSFAKETKPNQHKLLSIIDKSLDYYKNSGQYIQIRDAFEKFNAHITTDRIQDEKKGCKEPLIKELFNQKAMEESADNRERIGTTNDKIDYTTLYGIISNDQGIVDLGALEKINTIMEKDETIEQHSNEFSDTFTDKYKSRKADSNLEKNLAGI